MLTLLTTDWLLQEKEGDWIPLFLGSSPRPAGQILGDVDIDQILMHATKFVLLHDEANAKIISGFYSLVDIKRSYRRCVWAGT